MGGPVSIKTLGIYRFSEKIYRSFYVPSYFPFYGRTENMIKTLDSVICGKSAVMVITIHWAWEADDGYASLDRFILKFRDKIVDYKTAKETWLCSENSEGYV